MMAARKRTAWRPRWLGSALALTLGMAAAPSAASAQWVVVDPTNLVQNTIGAVQSVIQVAQQLDQINYQIQALKRLDNATWRDIVPLMAALDNTMIQGAALGYSLADLPQRFDAAFGGYLIPSDFTLLSGAQRARAEQALATTRAGLLTARQHAQQFEQNYLKLQQMKQQAGSINGHQEALDLANTMQAFVAEELAMMRQLQMVAANMQAVEQAMRAQRELEQQAAFRTLTTNTGTLSTYQPTFNFRVQ
jgi:P-type conjugative transfer protein TrbJ